MCATPSLRPMFAFPGWVIEEINIDWEVKQAFVYLRRDGRIQHEKCSKCETPMGPGLTHHFELPNMDLVVISPTAWFQSSLNNHIYNIFKRQSAMYLWILTSSKLDDCA